MTSWQTITARVVPGHRVASGQNGNPRFPGGTLRMQDPYFNAMGLDLGIYHKGTLNVSIAPWRYEVRSPATVLELIALAQGFTDFASRERIVVLRQNGTPARITFNYRKIADGTDQDNFLVQAGDIIVVP